jgi:hypothetical protein
LKLDAQGSARIPDLFHPDPVVVIGRVRKDRDAADIGDCLHEQFQQLREYLHASGGIGDPCDVPPRLCEAGDEPAPDGIASTNHDDRNRRARVRCGCRGGRPQGYDDVDLEPEQLGRTGGKPIVPIGEPVLDDDVLSFNPPELAQPLPERFMNT